MEKSRWWWFDSSHKNLNHSQWLHCTLSELDATTMSMLKLIEGNADSFAQRAETYYKKRPQLISFVEDFYRTHRSLAERFDQHLRSSSKLHLESTLVSVCGSNSSEFEDADSAIEDPADVEEQQEYKNDSSPPVNKEPIVDEMNSTRNQLEQEEEMFKLIEESATLRKLLLDKDQEKIEVIRQLSQTIHTLQDDNLRLKRLLGHGEESLKKNTVFKLKQPIDKFIGKFFYIMCNGNK
ncbi:unnamed protein product [Cochlearia groenlandica]